MLPNGTDASKPDTVMKEESMPEVCVNSQTLLKTIAKTEPQEQMDGIPQTDLNSHAPQQSTLTPQAAPVSADQQSPAQAIPAATPPATTGAIAPSRSASIPPPPPTIPQKPVAHGGSTRQYLNLHVTQHLLEGMKYLAAYEPEKPLQWLSDFLKERSKEVEG